MVEASDELLQRSVVPFYLRMMGRNAVAQESPPLSQLARVADATTPQEVALLLGGRWRPRVMGAWLSVRFRGQCVEDALLASIRSCPGDLAAAPLATAACIGLGSRAIPALEAYAAREGGVDGSIIAALEHLGAPARSGSATGRDRETFEQMIRIAQQLQAL